MCLTDSRATSIPICEVVDSELLPKNYFCLWIPGSRSALVIDMRNQEKRYCYMQCNLIGEPLAKLAKFSTLIGH